MDDDTHPGYIRPLSHRSSRSMITTFVMRSGVRAFLQICAERLTNPYLTVLARGTVGAILYFGAVSGDQARAFAKNYRAHPASRIARRSRCSRRLIVSQICPDFATFEPLAEQGEVSRYESISRFGLLQKDFFVLLRRSIFKRRMRRDPLEIISPCSRCERPDEGPQSPGYSVTSSFFAAPPHFVPNSA
jgi:hypothetical protein